MDVDQIAVGFFLQTYFCVEGFHLLSPSTSLSIPNSHNYTGLWMLRCTSDFTQGFFFGVCVGVNLWMLCQNYLHPYSPHPLSPSHQPTSPLHPS